MKLILYELQIFLASDKTSARVLVKTHNELDKSFFVDDFSIYPKRWNFSAQLFKIC